ncbi:MAG: 4-(cytidine 5'-diphospho)-2-C-methyl-D-erythritol kinase, partial [Thermodesulfovibrionales bacterium]
MKAPAKINWFLIIKGLRNDGYHEIISLMQRVSVYDELIFEPSDKMEIITEANIPFEENLIYRAAILIKNRFQTLK